MGERATFYGVDHFTNRRGAFALRHRLAVQLKVTNWQVLHPVVNVFPTKTTMIHAIRLSGILTGAIVLLMLKPHATDGKYYARQ